MSLVTNVVRRGGSYYFRVRVPKPLVGLLGRSQLWKSLRTNCCSDARRRAATQAVLTEALWGRLGSVMDMNIATSFVKDWLAADLRNYASLRNELSTALASTQPLGPAKTREGAPVEIAPQVENNTVTSVTTGLKLSKASRDFVLEVARSGQVKLKRLKNYETALAAFSSWLGEDRDLAEITTSHAGRFKTALTHYPARGSVRPAYRQLDFKGRIALAQERNETDTLDPTSINNKYLGPIRAMFEHYRKSGFGDALPTNPFDGIAAKRSRKTNRDQRRRDFTVAELQRLFDQPLFVGSAATSQTGLYQRGEQRVSDWRYWVPLLCIFSGLRLNEACGLAVADFKEEDGIDYFLVRDTLEGQSIKSDNAWRRVPVHAVLIELGLLRFVEQKRRGGAIRLFDELEPDVFGYFSTAPSKFLNRMVERVADPDPLRPGKLTFHSTRHTVVGRMRSADVRIDVAKEIVGHEEGDTHAGYGGVDIATLKRAVDQITYKGLDLSRIRLPTDLLK